MITPFLEARAVEARGLTKRFGNVAALTGPDVVAEPGQVAVLLGPNAVGKTAFVSVAATLPRLDGSDQWVAGAEALAVPRRIRRLVGLASRAACRE